MCLITSTVQPLPNILYCCVSETAHLYQSGIVCKRAHSVGVSRLMRASVASPSVKMQGCPLPSCLALAASEGDFLLLAIGLNPPSTLYVRYVPTSMFSFISTTKLFCSHALADRVGDLSMCIPPLFAPRGLCNIRLSLATVVRQFVLFGSGAVSSCCIVLPPCNSASLGNTNQIHIAVVVLSR